ncbi:SnoaL-like domain-containing protein [Cladophialophora immunda]|nr:SnoaL-like domain-containing protein [Cladophialophora immunda]
MSSPGQTEITRATAKRFMTTLGDRRMEDLGKLFAPGGTWAVIAQPARAFWGGVLPGPERAQLSNDFTKNFESWQVGIVNLVAEGDTAFVEGSVRGRGPGNQAYTNTYMMRFIVDADGMITDFKEGMDSYEVEAAIASVEEHQKQQETQTSPALGS